MKHNIKTGLLLLVVLIFGSSELSAQQKYSLVQLVEAARNNNRLLTMKEYEVREKISKLKEDGIKRYPAPKLEGNYQYNFNLPDITVPAGSLGTVNTGSGGDQLLPAQASRFAVGQKGTYNVGVDLYQPISQQFRIKTGLDVDRLEIKIVEKEKEKILIQLQLSIEQLYYGVLILQKQQEAGGAKLELAKTRLYDAQGAVAAGKEIAVSLSGLRASIAEQEQDLLKLSIQEEDYLGELSRITNLDVLLLHFQQSEQDDDTLSKDIDAYKVIALGNPDIEMAKLNIEKASLGVKAAKQSNIPDFGLIGGYYLQQGNPILPTNSPYLGISLRWNIQDIFSNRQVQNQRFFQLKQAEENMAYTKQQVNSDLEKGWRKIKQTDAMIGTAEKLVGFRRAALKEQMDRQSAGLDIKTAMLETRSQLAEAEAGLYAAKLSSVIARSELRSLTGQLKNR